jgi:ribonuclease J
LVSQGWIDEKANPDLVRDLEALVAKVVKKALAEGVAVEKLERLVRRATGKFVGDRTRRRPPINAVVLTAG